MAESPGSRFFGGSTAGRPEGKDFEHGLAMKLRVEGEFGDRPTGQPLLTAQATERNKL